MQWSKMSVREGNILEGSCSSRLERAESFLIYFTRICYALCSLLRKDEKLKKAVDSMILCDWYDF